MATSGARNWAQRELPIRSIVQSFEVQIGVDLPLQAGIVGEPRGYCPGPVMAAEQVEFEAVRSASLHRERIGPVAGSIPST